MFVIIELSVILGLIWLIGNVARYWFFKDQVSGGPFALSDRWIELDNERNKEVTGKRSKTTTKEK